MPENVQLLFSCRALLSLVMKVPLICGSRSTESDFAFRYGDRAVAHPQRLEIRLFGTSIRAEGIAGIVGAIALVGLILIAYFRN